MRKLIPNKLINWAKALFNNVQPNGDKTELGGDVEIDGDLQLNSAIIDGDESKGTNGQVLTSTGSGVEWKSISSGGTQLYKHIITFSVEKEEITYSCQLFILSNKSTAYIYEDFIDLEGDDFCNITGELNSSEEDIIIYALTHSYFIGINGDNELSQFSIDDVSSHPTINDVITQY